jgi:hypothetical protein
VSLLSQDLVICFLGICLGERVQIRDVFCAISKVVIKSLAENLRLVGCHRGCSWEACKVSRAQWNSKSQVY